MMEGPLKIMILGPPQKDLFFDKKVDILDPPPLLYPREYNVKFSAHPLENRRKTVFIRETNQSVSVADSPFIP